MVASNPLVGLGAKVVEVTVELLLGDWMHVLRGVGSLLLRTSPPMCFKYCNRLLGL